MKIPAKVDKAAFDATLGKLLKSPPAPLAGLKKKRPPKPKTSKKDR
jgi:hypothetical protein